MLAPVGHDGHSDDGGSNSGDAYAHTDAALVVTHDSVNVEGVQSDGAHEGGHRHEMHRICGMPRALAWEVWTVALLFFVYVRVAWSVANRLHTLTRGVFACAEHGVLCARPPVRRGNIIHGG